MLPVRVLLMGWFALFVCEAGLAQGFWVEKNFSRWSEKECRKMLEDSPWARRFVYALTYFEPFWQISTLGPFMGTVGQFEYVVQIRSALPIRQALVRQKQLETHHDKASPAKKNELDAQAQAFLSMDSSEVMVVCVMYSANMTAYNRELVRYWQILPPEIAIKQILLLAPGGQWIHPLTYDAGESGAGAFQLTFPKNIDGKPILTPQNEEMKIEFQHPDILGQGGAHVVVSFNLLKMTVDRKLLY
jgi:hypothetical protein